MKLSRATLWPLIAAHERGALPLVGAAWGVTASKSSHNASNARGVTAGKMGRNSSEYSVSDLNPGRAHNAHIFSSARTQ